MTISAVPAPRTQPPHRFKKRARSTISGSLAAPCRRVWPRAAHPASSTVSVAPTLGPGRRISAPCSPAGAVRSSRWAACSTRAPIRSSAARCQSTGRAPILHPPGSAVSARPSFASRGAANNTDARSRAVSPAGRRQQAARPLTTTSPPSQPAAQPAARSRAGSSPHPTGPARPAAAPAPRTAGLPPAAAARCSWPPGPAPSHTKAARPAPRSSRP